VQFVPAAHFYTVSYVGHNSNVAWNRPADQCSSPHDCMRVGSVIRSLLNVVGYIIKNCCACCFGRQTGRAEVSERKKAVNMLSNGK
jgi:hypothetical protein